MDGQWTGWNGLVCKCDGNPRHSTGNLSSSEKQKNNSGILLATLPIRFVRFLDCTPDHIGLFAYTLGATFRQEDSKSWNHNSFQPVIFLYSGKGWFQDFSISCPNVVWGVYANTHLRGTTHHRHCRDGRLHVCYVINTGLITDVQSNRGQISWS